MALLSLAVGLLLALVSIGVQHQTAYAQTWEPIRVISASHEIDFPGKIIFRMDAVSSDDIVDVALYYRLGNRNITTYGYPTFEPSNRVTTEFTILTDGGSYIPTGVDIEYYYIIRDVGGNEVETERFNLEYLDPAFDWERTDAGDFVVVWHDRPRNLVENTVQDVRQRLTDVKDLLGLQEVPTQKAIILNSAREANENFPRVSETATRQHVYGGFAFGELDVFVLAGLDTDGMIHEMTHLYIDEALRPPSVRMPSWLNEGLAMYHETGARDRARTLSRAVFSNSLLPLTSMGSTPGRPSDVRVFYAQSWGIVTHMMEMHGAEKMSRLVTAINNGMSIEEAVPEVYGMTLEELDAEWRRDLYGSTSFANLPDPGTIGTSAIIAAAMAFAMVVVAIRWLRRIFNPPEPEDTEL